MSLPEFFQNLTLDLKNKFSAAIQDISDYQGDVLITVSLDSIINVLTFLKNEHRFIYLCDMVAADRFTSEDRFEVIYNIISLKSQKRLFIKTRCSEENPTLPTSTSIWPAANWHEREAFDMFGIQFEGHPDMRRLFLPEDFDYYPLRKEFPLLGIPGSLPLPSTTPDSKA
jgi:NADH-quinone oxidoreductase subunit C